MRHRPVPASCLVKRLLQRCNLGGAADGLILCSHLRNLCRPVGSLDAAMNLDRERLRVVTERRQWAKGDANAGRVDHGESVPCSPDMTCDRGQSAEEGADAGLQASSQALGGCSHGFQHDLATSVVAAAKLGPTCVGSRAARAVARSLRQRMPPRRGRSPWQHAPGGSVSDGDTRAQSGCCPGRGVQITPVATCTPPGV